MTEKIKKIKMTTETCLICGKETDQYLNGYNNHGFICISCYYGKGKNCVCEFCNKSFNIKLFDTLRGKVCCPVCRRKNYIKEKGGLIFEDLSNIKNIKHSSSYYFILPNVLDKYLKRLEKKYFNKSRDLLIFTALSEYIWSKLKITKREEILELRPRNYKRERYKI